MVKDLYGVEVSTELFSKVTDAVHEEFEERLLEIELR